MELQKRKNNLKYKREVCKSTSVFDKVSSKNKKLARVSAKSGYSHRYESPILPRKRERSKRRCESSERNDLADTTTTTTITTMTVCWTHRAKGLSVVEMSSIRTGFLLDLRAVREPSVAGSKSSECDVKRLKKRNY